MHTKEINHGVRIKVLRAILDYRELHGYPPSFSELAGLTGFSKSGVRYQIDRLCADGLLRREPQLNRTLTLTDAGKAAL